MYFLIYLYVLPVPGDNNRYYLSTRVTKVPCWCKAEILCSRMGNRTQELRRQWDLSKESFCLRSPVWEAHPHGSRPGSVLSVCSTGAGNHAFSAQMLAEFPELRGSTMRFNSFFFLRSLKTFHNVPMWSSTRKLLSFICFLIGKAQSIPDEPYCS